MFKRYFIAAAALALLSACSTTDNLDASAAMQATHRALPCRATATSPPCRQTMPCRKPTAPLAWRR